MCKLTALLAVLLTVTGCEKVEKTLGVNPEKTVGRYQMQIVQAAGNQFIYILDTKTGTVWRKDDGNLWPEEIILDGMIKGF
jgi:hypothetical protein